MKSSNIIDFNTYKINIIIKSLCIKYHQNHEYFIPLLNELQKRNPNVQPNEIEDELDMFMEIKRIQERK